MGYQPVRRDRASPTPRDYPGPGGAGRDVGRRTEEPKVGRSILPLAVCWGFPIANWVPLSANGATLLVYSPIEERGRMRSSLHPRGTWLRNGAEQRFPRMRRLIHAGLLLLGALVLAMASIASAIAKGPPAGKGPPADRPPLSSPVGPPADRPPLSSPVGPPEDRPPLSPPVGPPADRPPLSPPVGPPAHAPAHGYHANH